MDPLSRAVTIPLLVTRTDPLGEGFSTVNSQQQFIWIIVIINNTTTNSTNQLKTKNYSETTLSLSDIASNIESESMKKSAVKITNSKNATLVNKSQLLTVNCSQKTTAQNLLDNTINNWGYILTENYQPATCSLSEANSYFTSRNLELKNLKEPAENIINYENTTVISKNQAPFSNYSQTSPSLCPSDASSDDEPLEDMFPDNTTVIYKNQSTENDSQTSSRSLFNMETNVEMSNVEKMVEKTVIPNKSNVIEESTSHAYLNFIPRNFQESRKPIDIDNYTDTIFSISSTPTVVHESMNNACLNFTTVNFPETSVGVNIYKNSTINSDNRMTENNCIQSITSINKSIVNIENLKNASLNFTTRDFEETTDEIINNKTVNGKNQIETQNCLQTQTPMSSEFIVPNNNQNDTSIIRNTEKQAVDNSPQLRQLLSSPLSSVSYLSYNVNNVSKNKNEANKNSSMSNNKSVLFQCDQCTYQTKSKPFIRYHINTKHSDIYRYVCKLCDRKFKSPSSYTYHKKTHNRIPFICDLCGMTFPTRPKLCSHMQHMHRSLLYKSWKCRYCKKIFIRKKCLHKYEASHNKIYICDYCNRKWENRMNFIFHLRRHTKPYVCRICKKSFGVAQSLQIHLLKHVGHRPYYCDICNSRYSYRRTLTAHRKTEHPKSGPLPKIKIRDTLYKIADKIVAGTWTPDSPIKSKRI